MSQNFFQIIRPVHVHLKTDKVDLKKRPPWKNIFLHFFSIDSSSRHEKRWQMLQTLFLLFQCSKNPQFCFFSRMKPHCLLFVILIWAQLPHYLEDFVARNPTNIWKMIPRFLHKKVSKIHKKQDSNCYIFHSFSYYTNKVLSEYKG